MKWEEVPIGICLIKMFHERTGKHTLHLHVKVDDRDWFDQPNVPAYSEDGTKNHREFWKWAEENLPIYDHPIPVKSGYA